LTLFFELFRQVVDPSEVIHCVLPCRVGNALRAEKQTAGVSGLRDG
jgi:hypothetical protein